jgi:hypothetical protein
MQCSCGGSMNSSQYKTINQYMHYVDVCVGCGRRQYKTIDNKGNLIDFTGKKHELVDTPMIGS